ncbi:MAG: D-aminoacyl-tRNA deacylase [Candidatus Omnitrophica bacterium]|nr:D-aminoacyl-tRNA deacylase [Candidatus Omnitrophota bacterium]MCM8828723.1 D-aminoacyl-tRNA deacylase [Candidatus Omnitrophota bacterium]
MKLVIQRVSRASIKVNGILKGAIDRGLVVLVGFGQNDFETSIEPVVRKILKLRIFADSKDKMNLSLIDVSGGLMVISQFTLYANTQRGNRPDFLAASNPDRARHLFDRFIEICQNLYFGTIIAGDFGKHMLVEIHNDGPVTIIMDY